MSTNETVEELTGVDVTKRLAVLSCGYVFFVLGIIGLAIPGLPSTVFWVVSAICFSRSSPKMYQRILTLPRVGPAIEDFISHGVIKRRSKKIAVTGMAVMAIIVLLLPMAVVSTMASIAGIAIGAVFVLTRPSAPVPAV